MHMFVWYIAAGGVGMNLGRPKDQRQNVMIEQQQAQDRADGKTVVRDVREGPAMADLLAFLGEDNSTCAECNSENVSWISMSIGVTCCEDCASIHRQLSWAVSKLKNIQLDEFYPWQVKLLRESMGNTKANKVWELLPPAGWNKPTALSTMEERSRWILAKYRWYGFVDEFRVLSDTQMAQVSLDKIATIHSVIYNVDSLII